MELVETTDGQIVSVKPKKTRKPAAKKAAKPKAKAKKKKPVAKRGRKIGSPGFYAKKKKPAPKKTKRKAPAAVARPERLDMRVSKAEKAKLQAKAKKLRRTVTSIMLEALEKIK